MSSALTPLLGPIITDSGVSWERRPTGISSRSGVDIGGEGDGDDNILVFGHGRRGILHVNGQASHAA